MIELTNKQQEYLMRANRRWNVKSGAVRSGKTFLDITKVIPIRIALVAKKEGLIVFLGNTRSSLQRNIIEPMQEKYGNLVSSISNDNTAIIFGQKVYCIGADKKSQVDVIRGMSIKYCYCDEVVTYNKEVFTMLKSRLDKPYSKCDLTCNPDSPTHWFKEFLDGDSDIYLQEYCLDDNEKGDKKFHEQLKKEYSGTVWYDRYILGKWVLAEGLIYPMFNKEKHVFDEEIECSKYHVSIDYGTMNPFSAGLWGYRDGKWWRINEYYHNGRATNKQLTTGEYYTKLQKLIGDRKIQSIIIDPSATHMIAEIKKQNQYNVRKAKNSIIEGIQNTASSLNKGEIMIHSRCKDCILEFETYSWDEKSKDDKPIQKDDHAMDDTRYFVNTILYHNKGISFD